VVATRLLAEAAAVNISKPVRLSRRKIGMDELLGLRG
jgi:hypothetical protein